MNSFIFVSFVIVHTGHFDVFANLMIVSYVSNFFCNSNVLIFCLTWYVRCKGQCKFSLLVGK